MRQIKEDKIYRIIDANLNRAKEGLRVCEDTSRFILDDVRLTKRYKGIRHQLSSVMSHFPVKKERVVQARNILGDVGKGSTALELKRNNIYDIFWANSQRTKESIRVLEEFSKLIKKTSAEDFKKIRYRIYHLEKEIVERF